jgi:hypothetical protein
MSQENQDNILNKTYSWVKEVVLLVNGFPRDQRFILGTKMENMALELLELMIDAYYGPRDKRKEKLAAMNVELEKLRFLIRMGHELNYYPLKKYGQMSESLQEIGRMLGAWLKSL